jgi:hypothetical protein
MERGGGAVSKASFVKIRADRVKTLDDRIPSAHALF